MWLMPSSTTRCSTAIASAWSRGGPITPGPGSCMAPNPTRPTWKEPSGKVCIPNPYNGPAGAIPDSDGILRFAEDAIDIAAGVVEDVDDSLPLLLGGGERGLRDGAHQLSGGGAQARIL